MTTAKNCSPSKHVCFVAPEVYPVLARKDFGTAGGAEIHQTLFAKALIKQGYKVTVVVNNYGQSDTEVFDGIEVVKCSFRYFRSFGGSRLYFPIDTIKLLRTLKKINAGIYMLGNPPILLFALALYKKLYGAKLIKLIMCDSECKKNMDINPKDIYLLMVSNLYLQSLRFVDYTIFQTDYQKRLAEQELFLKGKVIRNPADIENLSTDKTDKDIEALWVGSCARGKQPDVFLNIARQMPAVDFTMIMALGPDNEFNSKIISTASKLSNVNFMGFVPRHKVQQYFKKAKVFIFTSNSEGFPNVFLEAWTSGSIVVSLILDPDNVITRNSLGKVSGTPGQLKKDVDELLGNEALRGSIAQNARKYVLENHDPALLAKQLAEVFETKL